LPIYGTRTVKTITVGWFTLTLCSPAYTQISSQIWNSPGSISLSPANVALIQGDNRNARASADNDSAKPSASSTESAAKGLILRSVKRGLRDQKELYAAPFHPANFKWDALVLAGTGVLIGTDRQTSRALPTSHLTLYRNISNIGLGGTAVSAGGIWAYGIKKHNAHAKETGELELETVVNTFLIYTPLQFISGRERPGQGTGNGRFWRRAGFNTSFPSGHAMFTWSMATVMAHEYPKPWVKWLGYGAASSVSVGRFLSRQHYASDVFFGSVLGYAIATHLFHAYCDPQQTEACTR
jgi:membrane-associated phospholipid phosphatase